MTVSGSRTGTHAVTTTDGHVWSWDELVQRYGPAIESYARSRGIPEPADVAQDVFADVVERLATFTGGPAQLRSYMFTIAHRRIADRHRRSYRRMRDEPEGTADATPEEEIVALDEVSEVMRALGDLDERSRQVLLLRFIDELDTREIAAALELSATNVRAIQSRALRRVRALLESARHTRPRRTMALLVMSLLDRLRRHDPSTTEPSVDVWFEAVRGEAAEAGATRASEVSDLIAERVCGGVRSSIVSTASAATATTTVAIATTGAPLMKYLIVAAIGAAATISTGTVLVAANDPLVTASAAGSAAARSDLETTGPVALDSGIGADATVLAHVDVDRSASVDVAADAGADVDAAADLTVPAAPPLPAVTLPPVTIPDVTSPPATRPNVPLPTVALPPVTAPDVTLPTVTLPPVTAPDVTLPTVTLPPVTAPDVTLPSVTLPPVVVPDVTLPAVTVPDVTLPPVIVPTVTLPSVNVPAVPTVGADAIAQVGAGAGVDAGAGSARVTIGLGTSISVGL